MSNKQPALPGPGVPGMTKLEYAAIQIAAQMMHYIPNHDQPNYVADQSVQIARKVLEKCNV